MNTKLLVKKILELSRGKFSFGFAESCTGGALAAAFTAVPSISQIFSGSVVVYSNRAKIKVLGIDSKLIENYGAVSFQTAEAMAKKTKELFDCDVSVSVTGYAGPGGKNPGEIFVGISFREETTVQEYMFAGNRQQIQNSIVIVVLENLLKLVESPLKM